MQQLRKTAFWAFDFVKGSPVRKNYQHIASILDHLGSDYAKTENAKALEKILKYAAEKIPFYQKLKLPASLEAFPVTDKNLIRTHQQEFLLPGTDKNTLLRVTTSGSTGTPFTVYQNKDKKNRNVADVLYFAKKSGYELGNTLYYLRHWDEKFYKGKLQALLQNVVPVEVTNLTDDAVASFLARLEKDRSKKAFIGYPSAFSTLINYMQRSGLKPKDYQLGSVIATSETLTHDTKKGMEYFFTCPLVSRYSNMENGILAQQFPGKGTHFYINTASYVIEVLDMETQKSVVGKPGKIVVTDLYNYTMPMIRYDTGDIGVMETDKETGQPILTRVDGRKMDVIMNTKGEILSSFVAYNCLNYKGILQAQMIQEGRKEYTLKLTVTKDYHSEEAIHKEYLDLLGKDALLHFEYTDEIPLLHSGKRKIMVNNYLKRLSSEPVKNS